MAQREKKIQAIGMRREGASYSQIKESLGIPKSTLSAWLRDMPLPAERIRELRADNERRIEKFRGAFKRKREARLAIVRRRADEKLSALSQRDILVAGLWLYWGEGGKTKPSTTSISNTDPSVILFFMHWLEMLGVSKDKLRIHMHFYADMDVTSEIAYWSRVLGLPLGAFRKPYVKASKKTSLTYAQRFVHGTCNLLYENRDIAEYVLQSLECMRERFAPPEGI